MWSIGEDLINQPKVFTSTEHAAPSSSQTMMASVMGRIQKEEKWAHPAAGQAYSRKAKTTFAFVSSMLLVFFLLLFATTTLIPDNEIMPFAVSSSVPSDLSPNQILLQEFVQPPEETLMQFSVVASLGDPLIYIVPEEERRIPYGIIFSIFGIFCIIIGMSWITRI
jgi:hypothetical protein